MTPAPHLHHREADAGRAGAGEGALVANTLAGFNTFSLPFCKMTESQLPPRLAEIVEDFKLCEGKEKLELLLEYANRMPPLPERFMGHADMESVPECMTPVFVHGELAEGKMVYYFDVPEESPSVRGYASLISEGVAGATPEQILAIPGDFYFEMGLQSVLSPQRMNGLRAILAYIKRLAKREKPAN